ASCGRKLAEVLRGEIDPLHLLFPAGSVAAVEKLYQDSPFFQAMNTLVAEAFAAGTSSPWQKLSSVEIAEETACATELGQQCMKHGGAGTQPARPLPRARTRILELGAGTGGATAYVLPRLAAE